MAVAFLQEVRSKYIKFFSLSPLYISRKDSININKLVKTGLIETSRYLLDNNLPMQQTIFSQSGLLLSAILHA